MIVCQSAPPASAPEPRLTRAVDVVGRYGVLLRLLDRVVEGGVAVDVPAAGPRSDLDVLDQLGEQLAALGVDGGLLVLRGRPLGVAGHGAPSVGSSDLAQAALRTMSANSACTRWSPVSSGWNEVASSDPLRTATILSLRHGGHPGQDLDPGADRLHPGRADEHGPDRLGSERGKAPHPPRRSPPGGRTRCAARPCRGHRSAPGRPDRPGSVSASRIIPAQEP